MTRWNTKRSAYACRARVVRGHSLVTRFVFTASRYDPWSPRATSLSCPTFCNARHRQIRGTVKLERERVLLTTHTASRGTYLTVEASAGRYSRLRRGMFAADI